MQKEVSDDEVEWRKTDDQEHMERQPTGMRKQTATTMPTPARPEGEPGNLTTPSRRAEDAPENTKKNPPEKLHEMKARKHRTIQTSGEERLQEEQDTTTREEVTSPGADTLEDIDKKIWETTRTTIKYLSADYKEHKHPLAKGISPEAVPPDINQIKNALTHAHGFTRAGEVRQMTRREQEMTAEVTRCAEASMYHNKHELLRAVCTLLCGLWFMEEDNIRMMEATIALVAIEFVPPFKKENFKTMFKRTEVLLPPNPIDMPMTPENLIDENDTDVGSQDESTEPSVKLNTLAQKPALWLKEGMKGGRAKRNVIEAIRFFYLTDIGQQHYGRNDRERLNHARFEGKAILQQIEAFLPDDNTEPPNLKSKVKDLFTELADRLTLIKAQLSLSWAESMQFETIYRSLKDDPHRSYQEALARTRENTDRSETQFPRGPQSTRGGTSSNGSDISPYPKRQNRTNRPGTQSNTPRL